MNVRVVLGIVNVNVNVYISRVVLTPNRYACLHTSHVFLMPGMRHFFQSLHYFLHCKFLCETVIQNFTRSLE